MATRADLITAVMIHIGELSAGEPVSSEDSTLVGRMVDNLVGEYSMDGMSIDTTSIQDFIFEAMKAVVSAVAAPAFEKTEAEVQRFVILARRADALIRNRLGPQRGHEPVEANYF